ncbi:MAG: hypothetical protein O3C68_01470 [Proteobacteria bacterium]|nr:hypothetical protein [Pseudomonadota bacterium]
MSRKFVLVFVFLGLIIAPAVARACFGHMYINPDEMGFFGGTAARIMGLTPPEPVFDLEHVKMAKAVLGQESTITVQFKRPFFSRNVRLKATGTKNIQVLDGDFLLEDREGSIRISYQLIDPGFDSIILTVTGENRGESVRETGRIHIRVSKQTDTSERELKVSGR